MKIILLFILLSGIPFGIKGQEPLVSFNYIDSLKSLYSGQFNSEWITYKNIIRHKIINVNGLDSIIITFNSKQKNESFYFQLHSIEHFLNGKYNGNCVFINSGFTRCTSYQNGMKFGVEVISTFANNRIVEIGNYKEGKLNGLQHYFVDGTLRSTVYFKKGSPNGDFSLFYPNGIPRVVGKVKGFLIFKKMSDDFEWFNQKDEKLKTLKVLEQNGIPYYKGLPNYVPQSILEIETGFKYFIRKGNWKYFSDAGELINMITY